MAKADKVAAVAELTERFQNSAGAVLTEYRGLTVAQLRELRGSLGEAATFAVVKNTLTKIAVDQAGLTNELSSLLTGPSAVAFVTGDVVETAKGLRDFAKANPHLVIKGGVLDGKALTPQEITKLADLEPREVLLAKLAGAMKASQANAVGTFAALPVQMAQLAEALRVKREAAGETIPAEAAQEAEAPAAAAPADQASADAASADAVPTDAVPTDAAPTDAAPTDAAPADAAPTDAAPTDAAPADAAPADAAPADAAPAGDAPADDAASGPDHD